MNLRPIAANQNEVTTKKARVLFSYRTPVAAWVDGMAYRTEKRWSVTTSRHINKWLDGTEAREMPQSFFDALV
jgi:hypothetical protein